MERHHGEYGHRRGSSSGSGWSPPFPDLRPPSCLSALIETLGERAHPARRFPGITVFGDNTFLARPDLAQIIPASSIPDSRILLFDATDRFISRLSRQSIRAPEAGSLICIARPRSRRSPA
ncbi:MAG: hypothetical protein MZV64_29820 [Ignavibacteriales bacterium]|nr:hypothetical protein [Ignavibacteriales bacterium]